MFITNKKKKKYRLERLSVEDHFEIRDVFEISKFEIAGLACIRYLAYNSCQWKRCHQE